MKRFAYLGLLSLTSIWMFQACEEDTTEPDTTPPAAVAGFEVDFNATTDGEVSLYWTANTESDLAGYKLFRDAGPGTDYDSIATTTETSYLDIGLDYDTQFSYKIQAYDKSGNHSDFTVLGERVAPINQSPPATPSNLTIYAHNLTILDQLDVQLNWSPNSESDWSHYKLYRANTGVFQANETTLLDCLTTNSYTDTDVEVNVHYYYKILSSDKGGMSSSPSLVVDDIPLPEPTLLSPIGGEPAASNRPTFTWQRTSGAKGYEISLRESPLAAPIWSTKILQPATGNPEVIYPNAAPALTTGSNYYWQVGTFSIGATTDEMDEVNSYSAIGTFKAP
ncbi:MAG: hypothetical protein K9N34_02450 [Candidatus Marinimicrobia bacterium]|nr:hypothetical protein [Candidatus Neomarinimicrobiota bacterium]MCF7839751.1 hypothetical protein [Candidatus Neomarinimicrobiota bacterium]